MSHENFIRFRVTACNNRTKKFQLQIRYENYDILEEL